MRRHFYKILEENDALPEEQKRILVYQDESHIHLSSKPAETLFHPDYPETMRSTANHQKGP